MIDIENADKSKIPYTDGIISVVKTNFLQPTRIVCGDVAWDFIIEAFDKLKNIEAENTRLRETIKSLNLTIDCALEGLEHSQYSALSELISRRQKQALEHK